MISNPATFFINESKAKSFTYEGGTTLFNWSPYDSKLSTSMESNVIFFANDITHAHDVLLRLFEFWISCNEQYVKHKRKSGDEHGLVEHREAEIRVLRRYVENIESMTIRQAPTNQFYEVGWASNDTLSVYEK